MCEMLCGRKTLFEGDRGVNYKVTAPSAAKLIDEKNIDEQAGIKRNVENLAKASRLRWYGHVLRRDEDDTLKVSSFKMDDQRKRGWPRETGRRLEGLG